MDNKTDKINFYIVIFNLLTIARLNEHFFSNSADNENFILNLVTLIIYSVFSIVLLFKRSSVLLLINHLIFNFYLFYYFRNNYMAQSFIFWVNGIFLWIGLSFFHKKISFNNRLNTVQFYLVSCYALAGIQKCFNLIKSKDVFADKMGLASSLLSDYVFLSKNKSNFVQLFYDYSLVFNIAIAIVILFQVSLVFLYSQKNKNKIALALCFFHISNALFLGISFIHALYLLIIFFLIPMFEFKKDEDHVVQVA